MRGTLLYIGQRLILIAITTVLVSSIVFLLLHQIPGNAFLIETRTSPEAVAEELRHYGLDKPRPTQYLTWVAAVFHGNRGEIIFNRRVPITRSLFPENLVMATLETIRTDYVRTAWAKGLKARVVVTRHALRNALIPVVTILGPLITGIITGSVVIENIFGIPGLGKEFVTSILARDYNIVIGVFTFYAALVGLANLTVDVIYPALDPRIRY